MTLVGVTWTKDPSDIVLAWIVVSPTANFESPRDEILPSLIPRIRLASADETMRYLSN